MVKVSKDHSQSSRIQTCDLCFLGAAAMRNAVGVTPTIALNDRLKLALELNPASNAISSMSRESPGSLAFPLTAASLKLLIKPLKFWLKPSLMACDKWLVLMPRCLVHWARFSSGSRHYWRFTMSACHLSSMVFQSRAVWLTRSGGVENIGKRVCAIAIEGFDSSSSMGLGKLRCALR